MAATPRAASLRSRLWDPGHVSCAQPGSDVITRTARERINWASYKISQATDRLGVFVSIVSTKIPYKGAGKEYIGTPTGCVSCTGRIVLAAPGGCHEQLWSCLARARPFQGCPACASLRKAWPAPLCCI